MSLKSSDQLWSKKERPGGLIDSEEINERTRVERGEELVDSEQRYSRHKADRPGGLLEANEVWTDPCFDPTSDVLKTSEDLYEDRHYWGCDDTGGGPVISPGAHVPEDPVLSPVVGDKWFEGNYNPVHTIDVDDWEILYGLTFTKSTGNMYILVEGKFSVNFSTDFLFLQIAQPYGASTHLQGMQWREYENAPTHTVDVDDWEIKYGFTITSS